MAVDTKLDRIDFAILRLLAKDAWLSNKRIAAEVGLAPSSCHERIKSLRARGVLLGAHAEVNLEAMGLALEAVLFVQLGKLEVEVVDDFDGDTYRAVYAVRFAGVIYVLHCFQKKSKKGRETPKHEIDLVTVRLKAAEAHYRENYGKGTKS